MHRRGRNKQFSILNSQLIILSTIDYLGASLRNYSNYSSYRCYRKKL